MGRHSRPWTLTRSPFSSHYYFFIVYQLQVCICFSAYVFRRNLPHCRGAELRQAITWTYDDRVLLCVSRPQWIKDTALTRLVWNTMSDVLQIHIEIHYSNFINEVMNTNVSLMNSLRYVDWGLIAALDQVMLYHRTGGKSLSEPLMAPFTGAYVRHPALICNWK